MLALSSSRLLITVALVSLLLQRLSIKAAEITAEWTYAGIGDWTNQLNWKDGIVPVQSQTDQYNVIITNASYAQCTLAGTDMDVQDLTLGAVLYVYDPGLTSRQFHVRNTFDWLDGSLSVWNAVYHLHGNTLLEGNTVKTFDRQCTLRLYSNAVWTAGDLLWAGYGQVSIEPSGVLESRNGGYVGSTVSTDSATITNRGTVRIVAPGKTTRFYGSFINNGLLDVQGGDVQFWANYSGPGSISITQASRAI